MEENLPPGFRFHPTDEELITYYLTNKVSDFSFSSRAIADVDLNKCEPWDLPAKASMGEKEWYFFSLRDRKYPTGMRTNRATEAGYWKTTGKDKEIFRGGLVLVGMKKTLVFYKGRAPKGEKTNWVMHEYRLEAKLGFKPSKEEWVVCRIFQKSTTVKKPQQTPSSPHDSMESPYNCDTNTIIIGNELGDIELPNSTSSAGGGGGNIINAFSNINYNDNNVNLNMTNTNNVLNWSNALREAAANVLPSTFLNPTATPMSPLLLRALQLSTYHQSPAMAAAVPRDYALLMSQGINYNNHFGNNDLIIGSDLVGSSSRVNVLDQQRQEGHHHQQEQPFNLDSDENIW